MDNLLAFLHVVETSSVSTAAERLKVSKSVISKRITDLESQLGVQLFQRSGHRIFPTENALIYSRRLCQIMSDLDQASELVAKDREVIAGEVRIACPISLGRLYLAPALITLAQKHPQLSATLLLDDRIYEYKLSEGCDLAIRMGVPQSDSLIVRKLATSSRVVCCSPSYAARFGLPKTIDDLASHTCLTYANVLPTKVWQFDSGTRRGKPRSISVRSRLAANTPEILRDGAIAGLGLAVLPMFVVSEALRDGRLIDALPNTHPTSDVICVIRPPNERLPARVRAVIDHLAGIFDSKSRWDSAALDRPRTEASRNAAQHV